MLLVLLDAGIYNWVWSLVVTVLILTGTLATAHYLCVFVAHLRGISDC